MKLLIENWRGYLKEGEHRQQILSYLEENNIVLTEEELEEGMPNWLKKLGAGAALAGTLAGVGGPAMAQDTEPHNSKSPQTHQVDSQSETGVNKLVDNGDGTGSITFEYAGAGGGDIGNLFDDARSQAGHSGLTGDGEVVPLDASGKPAQDLFGFTDVKFLKVTGTLAK